jgi:polar amino acid transport system substrate-binding protein
MFSYETKVAKYSINLNGYDSDDYEVIYTLANNELYFAFNRLTPDKIINKWQNALDKIKANGIYDTIIKQY